MSSQNMSNGMILVEITPAQRSAIMDMASKRMDAMRDNDPNSWTTYEYAQLENLAGALFLDCAE